MPKQLTNYKKPIKKDDALKMINEYRRRFPSSSKGIHFSIEELESYIEKWKAIMNAQPLGDKTKYAVGHHFALTSEGNVTIVVAPVIPQQDPAKTKDALNAEKGDFTIEDQEPYFFFNEGQKWP